MKLHVGYRLLEHIQMFPVKAELSEAGSLAARSTSALIGQLRWPDRAELMQTIIHQLCWNSKFKTALFWMQKIVNAPLKKKVVNFSF